MNKNKNKKIWGWVVIVVVLCATGCSSKVKVSGKVTFPDGSPLTVGKVAFETESFVATGVLQEDGTYILGTESERDGIPPGLYKVYVAGAMQQIGTQDMKVATTSASGGQESTTMAMPMFVPAVAPKYSKADTSGIICEVKKSMTFDFEVEPPQ